MEIYVTKDFFSIKEFASKLGVHPRTIWRAIKNGHIQAFRVGIGKSVWRIPSSEIQRMALFDLKKVLKNLDK